MSSPDRIAQLEAELDALRADENQAEQIAREEKRLADALELKESVNRFMQQREADAIAQQRAASFHERQQAALDSGDLASGLSDLMQQVLAGNDPNAGRPAQERPSTPTTLAELESALETARAAGDAERVGKLMYIRQSLGAEVHYTPEQMAALDARAQEILATPSADDPYGRGTQELVQNVIAMHHPEQVPVASPAPQVDERTPQERMEAALKKGDIGGVVGTLLRDQSDRLNSVKGVG